MAFGRFRWPRDIYVVRETYFVLRFTFNDYFFSSDGGGINL